MSSQNCVNGADQYTKVLDVDALVVGAGFSGCYMLHILRKLGLSVKVFETGKGFGGTWHWNRYPGSRVDIELPYYGYSDPDIWSTFTWTERFASNKELRRYFEHVDNIWGLSKDVSFETTVVEARFQEDGKWLVKTADGRQCRCIWFVPCSGASFKKYIPQWKGIEKFKGQMHHSSIWPEQGVDVKGKRVAIIGAGATGVQIMQEVAKEASHVTQFIRTPNYALPMRQKRVTREDIYSQKPLIPFIFDACRRMPLCMPMKNTGRKVFDDPPELREAIYEEAWEQGGLSFLFGCYTDEGKDKAANRSKYDFWAKKTRVRISDPKKRDLLAPLEPPYLFATKRSSLEQDYYEMADQPHVEIENAPILEFEDKGIMTKGKLHEFDVIAIATGFDSVDACLVDMGIKSRDGVDLCEKWKDGISTELGMMVHGYPNMFIVFGPQAPSTFTNGPPFIELQCEWIAEVISKMRKEHLATIDAKKEAEEAWRKTCIETGNKTLFLETDSWYTGANIPGKRVELLLYVGGVQTWLQACQDALKGWKDFDVKACA